MKKALLYVLALGLSTALHSQNPVEVPRHHFALVLGPNLDKAIRFGLFDDDLLLRAGYSLGVDYIQALSPVWQAKFSARYQRFNFAQITYTLQIDTIGSFPVVVGSNEEIIGVKNDAWSISVGVRKLGKPARLRWFWDGEAGATVFVKDARVPALTLGLGSGMEWSSPQKNWTVFAEPVLRLLLWGSQDTYSNHLTGTVELGVRRSFGKALSP